MTALSLQDIFDAAHHELTVHALAQRAVERLTRRNRMDTEKATQHSDLPHPYASAGLADGECTCGRMELDPLHSTAAGRVEQASAGARLQTEKGA